MKRAVKRIIEDEKGHVLELVLILLTMGGLVLSPLLGLMSTGLASGQVYEKKTQEYYAADAGVEDAIVWLLQGKEGNEAWAWYCENNTGRRLTPIYINGRYVNVTLESLYATNTYKISSVATGPQGSTTVLSTLFAVGWIMGGLDLHHKFIGNAYVDGNVTVENPGGEIVGDLVTTGNLDLQNQTNLSSNVSVQGDTLLEQSSNLTGNLCVGGDLTLENQATITGNVSVEGNLTLGQGATIGGNVFIGGDMELGQGATVEGSVYADGDITISLNNPQTHIGGSVCATGNITISLDSPHAHIGGSVCATGDITITSPHNGMIDGDVSSAEGTVTVYGPLNTKGNVCPPGSPCPSCPCTWPTRPPCPAIPVDPLDIYTWEIVQVSW